METIAEPFGVVNAKVAPGINLPGLSSTNKHGQKQKQKHKPTQTTPQKGSQTPPQKGITPLLSGTQQQVAHQRSLCVDMLTLTVHVVGTNKAKRQAIADKLASILDNWPPYETGIRRPGKNERKLMAGGYRAAAVLLQPNTPGSVHGPWNSNDGAPSAILQCYPAKETDAFVRLHWNPARWTPAQHETIIGRLLDIVGGDPDELEAQLRAASVTRLDVALDLSIPVGGFYWAKRKVVMRKPWTAEPHGLETLYLGKKPSATGSVRIYDKARQAGLPGPLTRVETTLRSTGKKLLKVSDLPSLANPFLDVVCLDVLGAITKSNLVPEAWRQSFLANCQIYGLASAAGSTGSPQLQSKLKDVVGGAVPPFWKPALAWKQWPAVLAQALPLLFPQPE